MSKFKVVPMEPTPEMVAALKARLTTTSRGGILNAGHALADAISTAPAVQGEPVAVLLIDEPERTERGLELGDWDIAPNATAIEAFARLAGPGPLDVGNLAMMLHQNGQAIELMPQPAPDVAGLVDALELVMHCNEIGFLPESVQQAVSDALAAHRKQGAQP